MPQRRPRPATGGPGQVLDAYARQAAELARLVEDWQASNRRFAAVLVGALGELQVALEEAAAQLQGRSTVGGDDCG
jgi:hypothetical protein